MNKTHDWRNDPTAREHIASMETWSDLDAFEQLQIARALRSLSDTIQSKGINEGLRKEHGAQLVSLFRYEDCSSPILEKCMKHSKKITLEAALELQGHLNQQFEPSDDALRIEVFSFFADPGDPDIYSWVFTIGEHPCHLFYHHESSNYRESVLSFEVLERLPARKTQLPSQGELKSLVTFSLSDEFSDHLSMIAGDGLISTRSPTVYPRAAPLDLEPEQFRFLADHMIDPAQALLQALQLCDLKGIRQLVDRYGGTDVFTRLSCPDTEYTWMGAMVLAGVRGGDIELERLIECVHFLQQCGCEITEGTENGACAISAALRFARRAPISVFKSLIDAGADIEQVCIRGQTFSQAARAHRMPEEAIGALENYYLKKHHRVSSNVTAEPGLGL